VLGRLDGYLGGPIRFPRVIVRLLAGLANILVLVGLVGMYASQERVFGLIAVVGLGIVLFLIGCVSRYILAGFGLMAAGGAFLITIEFILHKAEWETGAFAICLVAFGAGIGFVVRGFVIGVRRDRLPRGRRPAC